MNGDKNYMGYTQYIPLNQWTKVIVRQIPYDSYFRFQMEVNGAILMDINNNTDKNRDAQVFKNVKAYLGNPWMEPAKVIVRNLTIQKYMTGNTKLGLN